MDEIKILLEAEESMDNMIENSVPHPKLEKLMRMKEEEEKKKEL